MSKYTFIKTEAGNYRPVNKRAHSVCKRAVSADTLRGLANGGLNVYVWGGSSHDQLRKGFRG